MFIFIELVLLRKRLQALKIVNEVETDFHRSVKFRIHTFTIEGFNLACFLHSLFFWWLKKSLATTYYQANACIIRQDKWDFYPFKVFLCECLALFSFLRFFFVDSYEIIIYFVCKSTLHEKAKELKKERKYKDHGIYYKYICTLLEIY